MNIQDKANPVDYGPERAEMAAYLKAGEAKAYALGNRGPIRYDANGSVAQDILDAYWRCGFYVFEGVLGADELGDIEADIQDVLSRLPKDKGAPLDAQGRPALGADCEAPTLFWSKPLGDPFGGTDLANGRHPTKMTEPTPAQGAPDDVVYLILGSLQFSEACLRTYGHPDLLAVAAAMNGDDFVPFTDALFIKEPGLGASVAWHQDGTTLWDSPTWDQGSHGFNFMGQAYGSTAVNGVWVVPGSHKNGRIDIVKQVADAGSERLPDAVPIICNAGDVVINNRQILHGSFANTGFEPRLSVNFGFHRRSSVLDVRGAGIHAEAATFDAAFIKKRSETIGLAISARQQRFPNETPYAYQPNEESGDKPVWSEAAQAALKDYNLMDLSI